jgi:two-component system, sensor histidine kinase PdtaS
MRNIFRYTRQSRHFPTWARYALTTLIVLVAFGMRYFLWHSLTGYPYLLFFPAVILVATLFDHGTGIYAVALSVLLAIYFFADPVGSFTLSNSDDVVATIVFLITGVATAILIEALHRAFHDLWESHRELKQAHEELARAHTEVAASEHEKDLLLDELTHRIKNDLTVVISLIQLQARSLKDETAKAALNSAVDRIRVLGNVHTRLSRKAHEVVVDTANFISGLCDDLRAALTGVRPVALRTQAESHPISHSRAVAVGLVANELITNAIKYAFPGEREGTIVVDFHRSSDEFCLIVEDDGVGAGDGDPMPSGGIGQRLVRALTLQLGGRFEATPRAPGTRCVMHFPVKDSDGAKPPPTQIDGG